jgi:hypothetical protein
MAADMAARSGRRHTVTTQGVQMFRLTPLSPMGGCGLVSVCALVLSAFGFLDGVRQNPTFQWSFLGAAVLLLVWSAGVFGLAHRRGRRLTLESAVRTPHLVQATAQVAFLLYWGWYWRQVYDSAFLIAAQLIFAYAFDMLLCWSRRDSYTLGFGPVPVILSINLFLWFTDDWFYLQFLLVAVGFAAKELIQWDKGGRRVHIFNPSSFPLAVFSLALILTGTSDLTWGQDIASAQFSPPHVYLVLFLVALPGQYLFGVASMTMSAVAVTYVFSLVYFAVTGVYYFYDSYVPIAVFLGMHLLFTDPSTAPRTELGRLMFGVSYGLSTVALYALLSRAGVPPFYDKLLQVPILNISIQLLDRMAHSRRLRTIDPAAFARALVSRQRNLAYMVVWAGMFALMSTLQGVGDRHPGQWLPFWQGACNDERGSACRYLADLHLRFCENGSGWACNEAGILQVTLVVSGEVRRRVDAEDAYGRFDQGCDLGFEPACRNLISLGSGPGPYDFDRAQPTLEDFPIILRGTKGPITDRSPEVLYALACRQGWADTCGRSTF